MRCLLGRVAAASAGAVTASEWNSLQKASDESIVLSPTTKHQRLHLHLQQHEQPQKPRVNKTVGTFMKFVFNFFLRATALHLFLTRKSNIGPTYCIGCQSPSPRISGLPALQLGMSEHGVQRSHSRQLSESQLPDVSRSPLCIFFLSLHDNCSRGHDRLLNFRSMHCLSPPQLV